MSPPPRDKLPQGPVWPLVGGGGSRGLIKTRPATALPCRDRSARRHAACARGHAGSAGPWHHRHRHDMARHRHGARPRHRAGIAPTGIAMARPRHRHCTDAPCHGHGMAQPRRWHDSSTRGHSTGTAMGTNMARPRHHWAWGASPGCRSPARGPKARVGAGAARGGGRTPEPCAPPVRALVLGSCCSARSRCCREPPSRAHGWGFKTFCTKVKSGAGTWGWGQAPPPRAPQGATAPLCPPTQLQGVWRGPPTRPPCLGGGSGVWGEPSPAPCACGGTCLVLGFSAFKRPVKRFFF